MYPMMASGLISVVSLGLAIVAIMALSWEKQARQRITKELSTEIAQIKQELAILTDQSHPPVLPRPDLPRRDRGQKAAAAGPLLIAIPDLAPSARADQALPPEFAARFGGVWDLADAGASASTISRATGQPIGQIELILALQRNHSNDSRG